MERDTQKRLIKGRMIREVTTKLPIRSATVQNDDLTAPRASFQKIRDFSSTEFSEEVLEKSSL
jgi:hypothetical protein